MHVLSPWWHWKLLEGRGRFMGLCFLLSLLLTLCRSYCGFCCDPGALGPVDPALLFLPKDSFTLPQLQPPQPQGWDGWMALPTQWTWVWASSDWWWWKGKPGVLQFMGSQRAGHDWATELNWLVAVILVISIYVFSIFTILISTRLFLFSVFLLISYHLILSLGMLCFLIAGYFVSKIIEII